MVNEKMFPFLGLYYTEFTVEYTYDGIEFIQFQSVQFIKNFGPWKMNYTAYCLVFLFKIMEVREFDMHGYLINSCKFNINISAE